MTLYKCFDKGGLPFAEIEAFDLAEAIEWAERGGRIVQRVDVPEGQGWHTTFIRGEYDGDE